MPVDDEDMSAVLPLDPRYPAADFETGYQRVFHVRDAIYVDNTAIVLPEGFPLWNTVKVYRAVRTAREAFDDMDPARFVFMTPTGRAGTELRIPSVADVSAAWYYARLVVDEDGGTSTLEIDAQIRFRRGNVISDIGVATWYAGRDETAAFLIDLARVSAGRISDRIYAP